MMPALTIIPPSNTIASSWEWASETIISPTKAFFGVSPVDKENQAQRSTPTRPYRPSFLTLDDVLPTIAPTFDDANDIPPHSLELLGTRSYGTDLLHEEEEEEEVVDQELLDAGFFDWKFPPLEAPKPQDQDIIAPILNHPKPQWSPHHSTEISKAYSTEEVETFAASKGLPAFRICQLDRVGEDFRFPTSNIPHGYIYYDPASAEAATTLFETRSLPETQRLDDPLLRDPTFHRDHAVMAFMELIPLPGMGLGGGIQYEFIGQVYLFRTSRTLNKAGWDDVHSDIKRSLVTRFVNSIGASDDMPIPQSRPFTERSVATMYNTGQAVPLVLLVTASMAEVLVPEELKDGDAEDWIDIADILDNWQWPKPPTPLPRNQDDVVVIPIFTDEPEASSSESIFFVADDAYSGNEEDNEDLESLSSVGSFSASFLRSTYRLRRSADDLGSLPWTLLHRFQFYTSEDEELAIGADGFGELGRLQFDYPFFQERGLGFGPGPAAEAKLQ